MTYYIEISFALIKTFRLRSFILIGSFVELIKSAPPESRRVRKYYIYYGEVLFRSAHEYDQ